MHTRALTALGLGEENIFLGIIRDVYVYTACTLLHELIHKISNIHTHTLLANCRRCRTKHTRTH